MRKYGFIMFEIKSFALYVPYTVLLGIFGSSMIKKEETAESLRKTAYGTYLPAITADV